MTLCDICKRAPSLRLTSGPTEMWGSNPRISAWSSAVPMCPPACTKQKVKTTVRDRELTGHLISTCLRVTCAALLPLHCRDYLTRAASG